MPSLICSYNGCLELMLRLISEKPDRYMIIVATHNEESVRQAVTRYTCVTDEPLLSAWSWVMLIGVLCLCFSMEQLGLLRDAGAVCFGQLLGMCDHVSLTLGKKLYCVMCSCSWPSPSGALLLSAQHGFSVYKSVPYGSVEDTLPYLVRRAQENRSVLRGIRKERDLLRLELRRRLREKITGAR